MRLNAEAERLVTAIATASGEWELHENEQNAIAFVRDLPSVIALSDLAAVLRQRHDEAVAAVNTCRPLQSEDDNRFHDYGRALGRRAEVRRFARDIAATLAEADQEAFLNQCGVDHEND